MKNQIAISGRLPAFEGKYTAAEGDKKSRMNWAINVQLSSKNDQGYYHEALVNFTAWGYHADQLQQINLLPKDDATRKAFSNISVSGRFVPGYFDNKEGSVKLNASIDVAEVEFVARLPKDSNNAPETAPRTASRQAAPAAKTSTPARPGARPGVAPKPVGAPKF